MARAIPVVLASFLAGSWTMQVQAHAILSELLVNPPGADQGKEAVEILATPNQSLEGAWLVVIDGDGGAAGGIDVVLDLSPWSTGSNGLLLIRDGAAVLEPPPDAETTVVILDFTPDLENGSNTFILGLGTPPAQGSDLDTDNDGLLDDGAFTQFVVFDALGWRENDGAGNFEYATQLGGFGLGQMSFNSSAFYRVVGCTGADLGWTGGSVTEPRPGTFAWNPTAIFGWGTGDLPALLDGQTLDPGSLNRIRRDDLDNDGTPECALPDADGDGVPDIADNCPDEPNEPFAGAQFDGDGDGIGDECDPCTLPCPPKAIVEGEACGESTNDGCNAPMPAYAGIACADRVCASVWRTTGPGPLQSDADWYALDVPAMTQITCYATSGVALELGIAATAGVPDCDFAELLDPAVLIAPCESDSVSACLDPGTWWIVVRPSGEDAIACGNERGYQFELRCGPPSDADAIVATLEDALGSLDGALAAMQAMDPGLATIGGAADAAAAGADAAAAGAGQLSVDAATCGDCGLSVVESILRIVAKLAEIAQIAGQIKDYEEDAKQQMEDASDLGSQSYQQITESEAQAVNPFEWQRAIDKCYRSDEKCEQAIDESRRAKTNYHEIRKKRKKIRDTVDDIIDQLFDALRSLLACGPCASAFLSTVDGMLADLDAIDDAMVSMGQPLADLYGQAQEVQLGLELARSAIHHAIAGFTGCPACGNPLAGTCFEPHAGPFCDDAACCSQVCGTLPACCALAWDESCAEAAAATCGLPCPADLDADGIVGGADLGALLAGWGGPGDGDLDGDSLVNGADLGLLLGAWGACP